MRTKLLLSISILIIIFTSCVLVESYGKFVGTIKAEWLDDGRRMKLLTNFSYIDPKNIEWKAPAGWIEKGTLSFNCYAKK